ncbi:MAG: hypothetical protein RXP28_06445 [Nitrososphaeria archaeon]
MKLSLSDRKFACPLCNSTFDRDVALALVILKEGFCLWDAGETPGDENASAMAEYLKSIPHVSLSMNWEATPFGGSSLELQMMTKRQFKTLKDKKLINDLKALGVISNSIFNQIL